MKESDQGILFSAPMVRALRAGRKTETRRLVTAGTALVDGRRWTKGAFAELDLDAAQLDGDVGAPCLIAPHLRTQHPHRVSPRLAAGTHLWVREALWLSGASTLAAARPRVEAGETEVLRYVADETPPLDIRAITPLYMPRWAARVHLDLIELRFARLHDLDAAAVRAEGIEVPRTPRGDLILRVKGKSPPARYLGPIGPWTEDELLRAEFASGWNALHPRVGRWESNPWVLVIRVKPADGDSRG